MIKYLDFEKPIEDIDKKINSLNQKDISLIDSYKKEKDKLQAINLKKV